MSVVCCWCGLWLPVTVRCCWLFLSVLMFVVICYLLLSLVSGALFVCWSYSLLGLAVGIVGCSLFVVCCRLMFVAPCLRLVCVVCWWYYVLPLLWLVADWCLVFGFVR